MPVNVSCECGKDVRVSEEKRGKRIKCPGCGEVIRVPDSGDADDEFAEETLPQKRSVKTRKRKGKAKGGASAAPLAIAGGIGVVVLVAVCAVLFWPRTPVAKPEVVAMPTSVAKPVVGKQPRPEKGTGPFRGHCHL